MDRVATVERDVAKKRPVQVRTDEAVRLHSDVAAKARIAAAFTGQTIADLLSGLLDPLLTKVIDEGYAKSKKANPGTPKPRKPSPE